MKRLMIIAILLIIGGLTFKANPQRLINNVPEIIVAVYGTNNPETIITENLIKSSIKTELRKLGFVTITHIDTGEWDHVISIDIMNPKYDSGEKSDTIIASINYHSKIPERFMTDEWKRRNKTSQVYSIAFPNIQTILIANINETEILAKNIVASYNNGILQHTLDVINSQRR